MSYKQQIKNTLLSLVVIAGICTFLIPLLFCLNLSTSLREGLIAEIVGSGFLGAIVASIFFYLQGLASYEAGKAKSTAFVKNLTLDINEAWARGASAWNLSGTKKFYFDNSILNSLYDIYEKNSITIGEYQTYLKGDKLLTLLEKLYLKLREGYIIGEKIDNSLYQIIRSYHHEKGLISANDPPTSAYIKAKLIAEMSDESVIKYLEWKSVPERVVEVLKLVSQDETVKDSIKQIKGLRNDLIKEADNLLKLAKDRKFS